MSFPINTSPDPLSYTFSYLYKRIFTYKSHLFIASLLLNCIKVYLKKKHLLQFFYRQNFINRGNPSRDWTRK